MPTTYEYRDVATSESSFCGRVAGTFVDTHAIDATAETITEAVYHRNGRVRLEHVWTFNVTGGDLDISFHLAGQTDGETFHFQYDAQDGTGWQPLATLTSASTTYDDLPASLSGEILVRATDAVSKESVPSTLTIDEMCFLSERTSTLRPRVCVSVSGPASEDRRAGLFLFQLADGIPHHTDLTVSFTIGGTATQSDYHETLSGSVVIPAGQVDVSILVTPVDDDDKEGTETLVVTLLDHNDYIIGIPAKAVLEIADNDLTQFFAQSEESIYGTATADYTATHAPDGVSQILAEERYTSGNQKTRLEHRWSFDGNGSPSVVEFVLSARHLTPGDPDSFKFELSVDGGLIWLTLATVSPSSPPDQTGAFTSFSGNAMVRVIDTDSSKDRSQAQVAIDHMFFRVLR